MRIDSLMVARMSGSLPAVAGRVRLVRRRGGVSRIRVMIRRSAASSAGVHAVKDRCLSASAPDAVNDTIGAVIKDRDDLDLVRENLAEIIPGA